MLIVSTRSAGWAFVGVQVVLLGGLILLPGADHWVLSTSMERTAHAVALVGVAVVGFAAVGLGSALTATPVPKATAGLRTGGLYRFMRHPIYSGVLLFVVGTAVASGSIWKLAVAIVSVVFFNLKARWEELRLQAAYPGYGAYAERTPRFIPHPRFADDRELR